MSMVDMLNIECVSVFERTCVYTSVFDIDTHSLIIRMFSTK